MDLDDDALTQRIGPRLRNALVADLVEGSEDPEEGNRHLRWTSNEPREWTAHLARQLGMDDSYVPRDVHYTLMFVIGELNRLLNNPALLRSTTEPGIIANEATRHLSPLEAREMLLAGPNAWRREVEEHPLSVLPSRAHRALGSALARLLQQWSDWDVVGLAKRWREAQAEQKAEEEAEEKRRNEERARRRASASKPKMVAGKLIPPPPPIEEGAAEKAGRLKTRRAALPFYEPPWESNR